MLPWVVSMIAKFRTALLCLVLLGGSGSLAEAPDDDLAPPGEGVPLNHPTTQIDSRCDSHTCVMLRLDDDVDPDNVLDTQPASNPPGTLYWGSEQVLTDVAGIAACDDPVGDKIVWDGGNGRLTCAGDASQSYAAGDGLVLSGGTFSVADGGITGAKIADGAIANLDVAAAANIDWTKISKAGSSLANLATRSAADLTTGKLDAARLPASGAWALSGDLSITGGKVGVGTATPGSALTVAGVVETTAGGVKFPDGTVQTTAAGSGLPSVVDHARSGLEVQYESSGSVKVTAGLASIGDMSARVRKTAATVVDVGQAGSYLAGSPAANQWVYVAVAGDGTIKLTTETPNASDATGTTDGLLQYRTYGGVVYRYLGTLRTDGSGNVIKFHSTKGTVFYDDRQSILSVVTAPTSFTSFSVASRIPPVTTRGYFRLGVQCPAGTGMDTGLKIRPAGSTASEGQAMHVGASGGASMAWADTSSAQALEYKVDCGGAPQVSFDVEGFVLPFD